MSDNSSTAAQAAEAEAAEAEAAEAEAAEAEAAEAEAAEAEAAEAQAAEAQAAEAEAAEAEAAREVSAESEEATTKSVVTALLDRRSRAQIQTVRLDSRDFRPSWPIAIASLEQLSGWAVLALRLGTLALIQQCVRELAEENARADLIVRLRALTDALAHMPLET